MFNFSFFPEIEKSHKIFVRKHNSSLKSLIRVVDKGRKNAERDFDKKSTQLDKFAFDYAKVIFDVFKGIKPPLLNRRSNTFESWDSVFGSDYNMIPKDLTPNLEALVEENGGLYRLPSEYYI